MAFDFDELEPRHKKVALRDLSRLSISDLADYITALEAEIIRTREEIARKEAQTKAAAAFFKS